MSDPTLPLQAALLARLTAEVSCPTYDAVPKAATKPYVVIDSEFVNNTTPITGRKREERLLYLSVWSDHKGQSEVKRINSEIAAALDEVPLPLSTGTAVSVRVLRTDTSREPDGVTYMGAVTLRIITQH
ncbi:DUF3168 domain-containing protein [Pseudomonas sp. CDFA 602]|uniref:DUF3168 domain-containing protein n=1 Tax=Pseudomonas californiensis TaxID=2829823 RepID=UPI001E3ED558|nr:DUF3168 domain-containing protein [Pseudomonas californiensis]MCD5996506.1 DUF3168 domain-containing protein [Pseudomonas californiensis]MCD6002105.1 DUF3168 domain-containing protein [Pseudomonas californiensis]